MSAPSHADSELANKTRAIFERAEGESTAFKLSSYQVKFLAFVAAEHSKQQPLLPLFPVSLDTIFMFMTWAKDNNIKGGYDSISNYVDAVIQWGIAHNGQADPRKETWKAIRDWRKFVSNFKEKVQAIKKTKLRIQPALFQAMMMDIDINEWRDMRDGAQYCLNFYSGVRVGHTSAKSRKAPKHLLRYQDVMFVPSIENPVEVHVYLRSTKTRKEAECRPAWHQLGNVEGNDQRLCPVFMMQRWCSTQYAGDPSAPLFPAEKDAHRHLPQGRTEFDELLKARIMQALPKIDIDPDTFDVSKFSGIGFRKGSLSALANTKGMSSTRLAAHGDHADVNTTMHYLSDTTTERAANSKAIASRFYAHVALGGGQ